MISIEINNEWLDLPSNIVFETERNNPYLGTDEIPAERTLPFTIAYTDKNYRILNYLGNFYVRNSKKIIDAKLYDNGMYKYSGQIIIQQHISSLNNVQETRWSAVMVFNSSSFFQGIKNKLLSDVPLGGNRSFANPGHPDDVTNAFWQHIHAARTPNAFDYTFYPIFNPEWVSYDDRAYYVGGSPLFPLYRNYMNCLNTAYNFEYGRTSLVNLFSIVPMIYVSYIVQKIFDDAGWKLQGDILQDPGYQKLTMVGTKGIEFAKFRKGNAYRIDLVNPCVFNLQDFLPDGVTVESFLINLKNRFGWKFIYNSNTKTATLTSLKSSINNPAKDWTKFVLSKYTADYKELKSKYNLINNIDTADSLPLTADTDNYPTLASVPNYASLPNAATTPENSVCYSKFDNTYYINQWDNTAELYKWQVLSHNIGNFYTPGATNSITSDISTLPTLGNYLTTNNPIGLVPHASYLGNHSQLRTGFQSLGTRFLFYHGFQNDLSGNAYPYASCHSSNSAGADNLTPWSINYQRKYGSLNNGTYEYWFKDWLNFVSNDDVRTMVFKLPVYELAQFNWDDKIRVNDVEFIAVSYKEIIPYPGLIEFKMKRIK